MENFCEQFLGHFWIHFCVNLENYVMPSDNFMDSFVGNFGDNSRLTIFEQYMNWNIPWPTVQSCEASLWSSWCHLTISWTSLVTILWNILRTISETILETIFEQCIKKKYLGPLCKAAWHLCDHRDAIWQLKTTFAIHSKEWTHSTKQRYEVGWSSISY